MQLVQELVGKKKGRRNKKKKKEEEAGRSTDLQFAQEETQVVQQLVGQVAAGLQRLAGQQEAGKLLQQLRVVGQQAAQRLVRLGRGQNNNKAEACHHLHRMQNTLFSPP